MKKRMMKKNLRKNREKDRKKRRDVLDQVQISNNAGLPRHEIAISKHSQIPINAKVVREDEGWVVYLSRDDQSIYLKTTDYHADPLRLTMENLHAFITLIRETK